MNNKNVSATPSLVWSWSETAKLSEWSPDLEKEKKDLFAKKSLQINPWRGRHQLIEYCWGFLEQPCDCLIGLQLFQTSQQVGNKHFFHPPTSSSWFKLHSNQKVRVELHSGLRSCQIFEGSKRFVGSITLPWELRWELFDSYFATRVCLRHPLMKTLPILPTQWSEDQGW